MSELTTPRAFIFVLMPFSPEFDDVYGAAIKPACKDAGAYCERVDEQIFQESILERIYNQINKADLIVADMSGKNPNVFYETGYAHALGKRVILVTKDSEDIPFDLKHYPHIIYAGKLTMLRDELQRRITWYLSQKAPVAVDSASTLEFYIGGQKVSDGATIALSHKDVQWQADAVTLWTSVSLYNPTNRLLNLEFGLALLFPSMARFSPHWLTRQTRMPDGRLLSEMETIDRRIPPFGWSSATFHVQFEPADIEQGQFDVALRMFTDSGVNEVGFTITLPRPQSEAAPSAATN